MNNTRFELPRPGSIVQTKTAVLPGDIVIKYQALYGDIDWAPAEPDQIAEYHKCLEASIAAAAAREEGR